jgi:hypothetical protein
MEALEPLIGYFKEEKTEALIILLIGLAAVIWSVYMWTVYRESFHNGIAVPLLLFGFIQMSVGSVIYFRTEHKVSRLIEHYERNPEKMVSDEIKRAKTVINNFSYYRSVEMLLVITGILLVQFSSSQFWIGLGTGLIGQSALMIVFDVFAARRTTVYLEYLQRL